MSRAFQPSLFRSSVLGGFERSARRGSDGRRLDFIAATACPAGAEAAA